MNWPKWKQTGLLQKITAVFIYLVVFLYVLIFRVFVNIVGSGEPEFFPIEILTTACILAAIVFIYMIYKKDVLRIGKSNILYPILLVTFFSYYLAENNWLLGRDHLVGVVILGAIIGSVFIVTLLKIYKVSLEAGVIFGLAIFFLAFGTLIDASADGYIPADFGINRAGLIEEVFELYASMFILHSLILLHYFSNPQNYLNSKKRRTLAKVFMGASVLSYGNSLLLYNRGEPVPISRTLTGLFIIVLTLSIFYIYFIMKKSLQNSNDIDDKSYAFLG